MASYGIISPQYYLAYPGKQVTFRCGSASPPKWLKNFKPFTVQLTVLNTLIISAAKLEDTGKYQCLGTYPNETKFQVTGDLRVGVKDKSRIQHTMTAKINRHFRYRCKSALRPRWYFSKQKFNLTTPMSHLPYLEIHSVQYQHAGYYYCYGSYEDKSKYFISITKLVIHDNSKIIPERHINMMDQIIYFSCNSPYPVVWKFNGFRNFPKNVMESNNNSLRIKYANTRNMGVYQCKGFTQDDDEFIAEGLITNRVKSTDRVIPEENHVELGDDARFICLSWFPVEWKYEEGVLPKNAIPDDQPGFYSLEITNVSYFNEGTYTCIGKYGKITDKPGQTFDNDADLVINGYKGQSSATKLQDSRNESKAISLDKEIDEVSHIIEADEWTNIDMIEFLGSSETFDHPVCAKHPDCLEILKQSQHKPTKQPYSQEEKNARVKSFFEDYFSASEAIINKLCTLSMLFTLLLSIEYDILIFA